jgi:hypothetical protein
VSVQPAQRVITVKAANLIHNLARLELTTRIKASLHRQLADRVSLVGFVLHQRWTVPRLQGAKLVITALLAPITLINIPAMLEHTQTKRT